MNCFFCQQPIEHNNCLSCQEKYDLGEVITFPKEFAHIFGEPYVALETYKVIYSARLSLKENITKILIPSYAYPFETILIVLDGFPITPANFKEYLNRLLKLLAFK